MSGSRNVLAQRGRSLFAFFANHPKVSIGGAFGLFVTGLSIELSSAPKIAAAFYAAAWIVLLGVICKSSLWNQGRKVAITILASSGISLCVSWRWLLPQEQPTAKDIAVEVVKQLSLPPASSTPTAGAGPSPAVASSPLPIQHDSAANQKEQSTQNNESPSEARQQNVNVGQNQTGTAFAGDIRIGLNGINFKVDPIRYTVNATISSPGYKSLSIRDREMNDPVIYAARAVYEIVVLTAPDSFSATFQVTRVQDHNPGNTGGRKQRIGSQSARHKAAIDTLLGKPK